MTSSTHWTILVLLADEFGTGEQKVRAVVCNYGLFSVDQQQNFFSPKLNVYMQPYFEKSERVDLVADKPKGIGTYRPNQKYQTNRSKQMYQVASWIWYEIEKTGLVRNPKMRALMRLDQERLNQELEIQAEILSRKGYSTETVLAYQQVAPLLIEREAIQTWMQENERVDLMAALPELGNVDEAVALMVPEFRLERKQAEELTRLLIKTLKVTGLL